MTNQEFPLPLELRQGQCFRYAIPQGWQVMEDGAHAVVLIAPDRNALTLLVGNTGVSPYTAPAQFVYQYLAPQCPNLMLSAPRAAAPALGAPSAWEFDYQYVFNGTACYGLAKCSVTPAYDSCTMVLTAAAAIGTQWPGYARWLPRVPEQVDITHSGAFGAQGVQQQNLMISQQEALAQQNYRAWSEQNWAELTRQREASEDRRHFQFRENLGAVQTLFDPYQNRTVELSTAQTYHWVNPHGQIWSTNDPSENPNYGSTVAWQRMGRPG